MTDEEREAIKVAWEYLGRRERELAIKSHKALTEREAAEHQRVIKALATIELMLRKPRQKGF